MLYLNDESIHPDANIETTKRVQVQYKIRVLNGVDPTSSPEAGLNSGVFAIGPNAAGLYGYENMGLINGDFGCWRAKCLNTVDGYCYAIPMFFINRRNLGAFNPATNINGENKPRTASIRPDLLTAANVMNTDILDVRRQIVISSVSEFLVEGFDQLSSNTLRTNFFQDSAGGVRFGTELLQIDRVGGTTDNGGTQIGATIADAIPGNISSNSVLTLYPPVSLPIGSTIPADQTLTLTTGVFHPNKAHYRAYYSATTSTNPNHLKPIPGYFTGQGTSSIIFHFSSTTLTASGPNMDPTLTGGTYIISAEYYAPSSKGLTRVPSEPKLVKNTSGAGNQGVFYQGVLNNVPYRTLEQWASAVPGYTNYSLVYSTIDGPDVEQHKRASSVEVHIFMQLDTPGTGNVDLSGNLVVPTSIVVNLGDVPYTISTIRRVKNITGGFIHRLLNVEFVGTTDIKITPVSGYQFTAGLVVEVIAAVTAAIGDTLVRNGAAVNFSQDLKGINLFTFSETVTSSGSFPIIISSKYLDRIIGVSTSDTSNLEQPVCWVDGNMKPLTTLTGLDTTAITIHTGDSGPHDVSMQLFLRKLALDYPNGSPTNDGLLISYNYVPPQTQVLPVSLTGNAVTGPALMYISDLGDGGGIAGEPYSKPIEQIPINNTAISDAILNNQIPLQFNSCTITGGFAQLQVTIPGKLSGESFTLSGSAVDSKSRSFYGACSREMTFETEGLQFPVGRKVYLPTIMRVNDPTNSILMNGEYVLVVFSRPSFETENKTG